MAVLTQTAQYKGNIGEMIKVAVIVCLTVICVGFFAFMEFPRTQVLTHVSDSAVAEPTLPRASPFFLHHSSRSKTPLQEVSADRVSESDGCSITSYASLTVRCREASRYWKFVEYVPSAFERRWYEHVKRVDRTPGKVSKLLTEFESEFRELVRDIKTWAIPAAPMSDEPLRGACANFYAKDREVESGSCGFVSPVLNSSIFSRMKYEYGCWSGSCGPEQQDGPRDGDVHFSFIEPLVGLMRHPAFRGTFRSFGWDLAYSKAYMLIDKWALHHAVCSEQSSCRGTSRLPSSFYFDLGASTWTDGAGGASQPWFYGVSWCMCKPFESWYLWEAEFVNPKKVFAELPGHIAPMYHWYNIPLATDVSSWHNPINHILLQTTPGDTVFVKVDYDQLAMEEETIQQILAHREVSSRIDELFFEHHVQMDVMGDIWKIKNKSQRYLSESIELFQSLRRQGIRAHSWV